MSGSTSRRRPVLIALTAGAVVAGLVVTGISAPPAGADPLPANTPPWATYRLADYQLYTGQHVTLIQDSLTDDSTAAADITQTIDWDDGSTETVPGTTTVMTHAYPVDGTYAPQVTVSDGTAQAVGGRQTPGAATVTPPVHGFRLAARTAWVGDAVTLRHHSSSDMTQVKISWGDGTTSTVAASVSEAPTRHVYRTAGTFAVTAASVNANGPTLARPVGDVTLKLDATRPTVTVTGPARPTRVSSWATAKGRSADTGRGVSTVAVTAVQKRGSSWYYYTGSAWTKATSYASAKARAKITAVTTTGPWSVKLKALAKGKLLVKAKATDKAGNVSAETTVERTLTS